jgi:hypothetical protein
MSLGLWAGTLAVKHRYLPQQFVVAAAFACIAVLYYIVFFVSIVDPNLGRWVNYLIYAAGWGLALFGLLHVKRLFNNKILLAYVVVPVMIITVFAGYYSMVLTSCRINVPGAQKHDNSTYCNIHMLPGDNALPYQYAQNIANKKADALISDWKLADRPPVQIGAGLGVIYLSRDMLATQSAYQAIATFLQLSWVAAGFGILITFGVKLYKTMIAIGFMSMSGFIYLNSIFVWPKFFAASLVAMGCALLLDTENKNYKRYAITAAVAMGLGLLIHDGVTFTILGVLAVLAILYIKRYLAKPNKQGKRSALPFRPLVIGGVAALLLVGPWMLYKSQNTTSDHLIKWHFAGVVQTDNRSTARTIIDSYQKLSFHEWYQGRLENIKMLVVPIERNALPGGIKTLGLSRPALKNAHKSLSNWFEQNDFYIVFFAFGLFNVGWLAVWLKNNRRHVTALEKRLLTAVAISIVVWVIVMFLPRSTVLHQGSYATVLVIYCLLATWIARAHVTLLLTLFAVQFVLFNVFWVVGAFAVFTLPIRSGIRPLLAGCVLYPLLLWVAWRVRNADKALAIELKKTNALRS